MRQAAAAALVLLVLSGCFGDDGGGHAPESTTAPTSASASGTPSPSPPQAVQQLDLLLAFDFVDCEGIAFQHTRPLDEIQPLLPEGFVAAPAPDSAAPQAGMVTLDLFLCGNLTTAAKSVPNTYIGIESTYVQRPLERVPQAPDAPVQEYTFRMLAGTDILAALWPAAGYDTFSGNASMSAIEVTDGLPLPTPTRQGRVGDDDLQSYLLTATGADAAALQRPRSQAFARYTVIPEDGSVLLWTGTDDLPSAATGPGDLFMPDGDPFQRLAPPGKSTLAGTAVQVVGGAVHGQDLRRIFT